MNLKKKKVWKFNYYTKIKKIRSRSKKKKVWKFKRNSEKYRVAIPDFFETKNFYWFKKSSALYQLTAHLKYRLKGSRKTGKIGMENALN